MCKDGKSNPMANTCNVEPRKALPKWDINPPHYKGASRNG